ncbi:MAG: hypothetical protein WCX81_06925 [Monoglobales bacterium]
MYKLQCDKNLVKVIGETFSLLDINADISCFSDQKPDITILRSHEEVINPADYIIANSDNTEIIASLKNYEGKIITCGMSTRSTVTYSSISEEGCVICIQRAIPTLSGEKIQPLEYPFEYTGKTFDEVSILMIITAALLCGADISKLKKIYV